ncbi:hypothetical protein ACFW6N_24550 [Streptomyces cyaneofuscatus]|uniref:hypothetical protein n=1 Tax=Streptomyces cyaneofuscatus TaxID=66883 RepID=UPI0036BF6F0F
MAEDHVPGLPVPFTRGVEHMADHGGEAPHQGPGLARGEQQLPVHGLDAADQVDLLFEAGQVTAPEPGGLTGVLSLPTGGQRAVRVQQKPGGPLGTALFLEGDDTVVAVEQDGRLGRRGTDIDGEQHETPCVKGPAPPPGRTPGRSLRTLLVIKTL